VPLFGRKTSKRAAKRDIEKVTKAPALDPLANLTMTLTDDTAEFTGRDGAKVAVHGFDLECNGAGLPLSDDGPVDNRVYYFRVAGVSHHQAAAQSDSFTPLSQVFLVREPSNTHDPNAIQVLGKSRECAGYVPTGAAVQMSSLMQQIGTTVVAATVTKTFGAHGKRVAIEVLSGIERTIELIGKVHVDDGAVLPADDQWKLKD
jgi:hypothetical protein